MTSMTTRSTARRYTPWGDADHIQHLERGIFMASTPGHGGYYVPPEVRKDWTPCLRDAETCGGPGWFEEDCDWAILALAMPDVCNPDGTPHLSPFELDRAVQTALWTQEMPSNTWGRAFFESEYSTEILERLRPHRDQWKAQNCYFKSGMGTSRHHEEWDVNYRPMFGNEPGVQVVNIKSSDMPKCPVPLNDLLSLAALGKCQFVDRLPPR